MDPTGPWPKGEFVAIIPAYRPEATIMARVRRRAIMATNWYGYHYHDGTGKRHCGITTNPQRRQSELQERWPGGRLYLAIGPVTEAEARAWEALQTETTTPQQPA